MQKSLADASDVDRASFATTDIDSERASCAPSEAHHKEHKLSGFFHKLSRKLKLNASPADDLESLLSDLGFGLDFVAVVQQSPVDLMADAAVCIQRLDRVKKVFVASKEEFKDVGTVVNIEVTLAPSRSNLPIQGIFHPSTNTSTTYVLTRPFDECRKLRKVIQFFASHEHEASTRINEQQLQHGNDAKPCAYCAGLKMYANWCWEQPPLLATAVLSKLAVMRKIVLTNSLTYFIHMARSQYPEAVAASDNTQDIPAAADADQENCEHQHQHQYQPADVPFCPAQAQLAILLYDFFQLQNHQ